MKTEKNKKVDHARRGEMLRAWVNEVERLARELRNTTTQAQVNELSNKILAQVDNIRDSINH